MDEAEKAESGSMSNIDVRLSILPRKCMHSIKIYFTIQLPKSNCQKSILRVLNMARYIPTSSYGSTTAAIDQCESEKDGDDQPTSYCAEQRQDSSVVIFVDADVRKEPPLGRYTASTCK